MRGGAACSGTAVENNQCLREGFGGQPQTMRSTELQLVLWMVSGVRWKTILLGVRLFFVSWTQTELSIIILNSRACIRDMEISQREQTAFWFYCLIAQRSFSQNSRRQIAIWGLRPRGVTFSDCCTSRSVVVASARFPLFFFIFD